MQAMPESAANATPTSIGSQSTGSDEVTSLSPSYAPAAAIPGTASRNEKRAALERVSPIARAAVIVTPEREVPGIAAAGAYEGLKLVTSSEPVDWLPMLVGVAFAALSGIACIHFLIRFIERIGLLPFTVYRLILAGVIVWHFA